tara:strand:- start:3290 stop:3550 length:261 start_codon:yes stop_codon:yes gene_type:complete
MARIKFTNLEVDKNVSQVSKSIKQRQSKTRITDGVVSPRDIERGEFVFTTVRKGQDGPSGPTNDESRIYFKDNDGSTFVFTGTKVG